MSCTFLWINSRQLATSQVRLKIERVFKNLFFSFFKTMRILNAVLMNQTTVSGSNQVVKKQSVTVWCCLRDFNIRIFCTMMWKNVNENLTNVNVKRSVRKIVILPLFLLLVEHFPIFNENGNYFISFRADMNL